MNGNLVVGAFIALIVIASIAYIVNQRRKGIGSCGCKCCNCCGKTSEDCGACCQNDNDGKK